ncbi:MAG: type II secretion system protein [Alphaproteobacteria bacterium]
MRKITSYKRDKGFTLLELSIVLVIIALIAGGVLAGRTMIRSAELQAVIKEYDFYVKALHEFNTKYAQLPGDFSGAEDMWGEITLYADCDANNVGYWSGGINSEGIDATQTCNGDGNGRIGSSTSAGVLSDTHEWWYAWQHLSNAGLIDGKYTGGRSSTDTAGEAELNINVPSSKFPSGGWTLFYMQQIADSADLHGEPTGGYGHMLSFGKPASGTYTRGGIMSPIDALDIDSKMDDGMAGMGKVRAWKQGYLPRCTTNDGLKTTQQYKTTVSGVPHTDPDCSLLFILGF